jgi:hypothetical protein
MTEYSFSFGVATSAKLAITGIFLVKVTCRAGLGEAPQMGVNSTNFANV